MSTAPLLPFPVSDQPDSDKNAALEARRQAACARGVGVFAPVFAERAQNALIWDAEGRSYIDFAGGIAVMNVGHGHPKVLAAVRDQIERFTHTCYQVVPYEGYVALAEALNRLVPGNFPKKTALFSTGAEATENAVKIARAATGRSAVLAFDGAFHGRTMMAMAMTGKVRPYKLKFGPLPAEVYHLPFPATALGVTEAAALRGLDRLFAADIDPARVAAVIIEPVQGEGGFYPVPASFLRALRARCDQHGILLIADEVQTGFGRTGRLYALEHYGVEADLVVSAKSLAAGFPLSAVTGRAQIMDAADPGGLGGTYAGNPVAIAAALAVIEIMREENLPARGARLGSHLTQRLEAFKTWLPGLSEVRGLGAMIAAEFRDPDTGAPLADYVKRVQREALDRGLVLLTCGVDANVVRFLFPLTIEDEVFEQGLARLEAAFRAAL